MFSKNNSTIFFRIKIYFKFILVFVLLGERKRNGELSCEIIGVEGKNLTWRMSHMPIIENEMRGLLGGVALIGHTEKKEKKT